MKQRCELRKCEVVRFSKYLEYGVPPVFQNRGKNVLKDRRIKPKPFTLATKVDNLKQLSIVPGGLERTPKVGNKFVTQMMKTSHGVTAHGKLSAEYLHSEDQTIIKSFASITSNSAYNAIDSYSPRQSEENNSCSFIPLSDKWIDNNAIRDSTTSSTSDGIKEPWIVDHNYNAVPEMGTVNHKALKERMDGDGDVCLSQDQSCCIMGITSTNLPKWKKRNCEGDGVKENVKIPKSMKQVKVEKLVTDIKENVKKPKMKIKKREKWILKDTPRKKIFLRIKGKDEQGDKCSVKLAQSDTEVKLTQILKTMAIAKTPDDLFVEELKGEVNSDQSSSVSLETNKPLESIILNGATLREVSIEEVNANHQGIEKSSVRLVKNGKKMDFRCTICKELPRQLNKSELYRHYAVQHFSKKLSEQFGGYKICPYCKIEFKGGSTASHFGQKHCLVEMFLPKEAWIPEQWNRSSGKKIYKKLVKVSSAPQLFFEWPENPAGFDPNGGFCGTKQRSPGGLVNSTIVEGFQIQFEKEIENEEETVLEGSCLNADEVLECQICQKVFEEEQSAVIHIQLHHAMNVSGDVDHDSSVLLKTGYIAIKKRKASVVSSVFPISPREVNDLFQELGHSYDPFIFANEKRELYDELDGKEGGIVVSNPEHLERTEQGSLNKIDQ